MKKLLKIIGLGGIIFILGIFLNVGIHEFGHYLIANSLNLNPEIYIITPMSFTGSAFTGIEPTFAYTAYIGETTKIQEVFIAAGGPLANLLFAGVIFIAMRRVRNRTVLFILTIFLIIALTSALTNLLPLSESSDGAVIIRNLNSLIFD